MSLAHLQAAFLHDTISQRESFPPELRCAPKRKEIYQRLKNENIS